MFVTVIVKVQFSPATVGVPEISPVEEFRLKPVGRFPLVSVHVIGLVPDAAIDDEYFTFATGSAGYDVVIVGAVSGISVTVKAFMQAL